MEVIKSKKLVSMLSNFPNIINRFLGDLPKDDYPVLDTFKFGSCWLSFVMDQSQSSMRDLFKRLNIRGIDMDISTFSKASKNRDPVIFHNLFLRLRSELNKKKNIDPKALVLDGRNKASISTAQWFAFVSPFERFRHCTIEVLYKV